jgi:metal-dependent amidase/aminoacylase/carboxypeptidase family protein
MSYFSSLSFCLLLLIAVNGYSQELNEPAAIAELKGHITFLANDKLQGRLFGSINEKKSATYISNHFKKYGLKPKGTNGFLQPFVVRKNLANPHADATDTSAKPIEGNNVLAYIDNAADNTIVIGAHYDHLGYNEYGGSTYRPEGKEKPQIHNGADDNASGTAALLFIAKHLAQQKNRHYNYLFIAFSGEEEGLLGSNFYTKNPTISLTSVNYMINMDMLGRLDTTKNSFAINGTGTSPMWSSVLEAYRPAELKTIYTESGTGASDHTSFYLSGIPVLHYFTGNHHDYHKPSDDESKINYQGEVQVIKHILKVISITDTMTKFTFSKTQEDTTAKVRFKVTLGIMPDYLYEGEGVRADGVTEGKTGYKAGLLKGDIIIQMNQTNIKSMKDYMKQLSEINKGDAVRIKVLRDGKEVWLNAQF